MKISHSSFVSRFSRRFFLTYVFTLACLAFLLADVSPAHALVGYITAYSSNRNGYYQIFLNDGDPNNSATSPDTAVTNNSSYEDTQPAWRPFFGNKNGGRIAFVRTDSNGNSEIYVADVAANRTASAPYSITGGITGNKSAPTWSPDGSKLAFVVGTGASKEVYVAPVNDPFTVAPFPAPPHTLVQCSLGSPAALTSGGSNEDPMWLYDETPINWVSVNGHLEPLHSDYGIAYVHRDSSGNGDIYKIPSGGGTAVNMTAVGDPSNIYDDVHPNITSFGTSSGEVSFTSNRGSGGAQGIYKTDGTSTAAQTALNPSSTGHWSAYSAYHVSGSSTYFGGVPQQYDLVLFVSHRPIELANGTVDATNLYVFHDANGLGPVARTKDGPGVVNKEPVNVYQYAEMEDGPFGTGPY